MEVTVLIVLSWVQFGPLSSEWLTKSEDQEVNDTQSCYQFIKTMTTSTKQTSHRLCVFVRKKWNTCISARCVITVRLHTSYWEITQAWRTPIKFDNFAKVLISLVRRMTVSFLLLWSLMLCMLFKHFFPLFYGMPERNILHIFSQFNYEFLFSQGGDSFKWRMRTARMGTKYSWLKKHTHENLQVRTSFLHFVVLFL